MKTQRVLVKDVMDQAKSCIVVHAAGGRVFVTSESGFSRLEKGDKSVIPIGFDREDVFEYDERYAKLPNWKKMKPWAGLR